MRLALRAVTRKMHNKITRSKHKQPVTVVAMSDTTRTKHALLL